MNEQWWVETDGGDAVFGPCVTREMAMSVRTVIEDMQGRSDLWVRQSARSGWVAFGLGTGDRPKSRRRARA